VSFRPLTVNYPFIGIIREIHGANMQTKPATVQEDEVTRLKRLVSRLGRQQAHIEVILACMSQGIALYDSHRLLLVANRRYMNIYGLREEMAVAGTPLDTIVQLRTDNDAYPAEERADSAARYIAMTRGDTPSPQIFRLRDGRIISVNCHPLEGGGWLSTHDDITELWTLQREVEHMAFHDQLTDLANRRLLQSRLDAAGGEADNGHPSALILIDLDEFKAVNDSHGHMVGDELLQAVAGRLRDAAGADCLVARLGGDEFAILCPRADLESPAARAEHIVTALRQPYDVAGLELRIGASAGVALIEHGIDDTGRFIANADKALYTSKRAGKGCVTVFGS
jgi:diguanylate cyclase (GGDEF)-like protein